MAKRRLGIILVLICFCFCLFPYTAMAVFTTDALEQISLDKECSLILSYGYNGTALYDVPVKLYRVADVSSDFQYTLTPNFEASRLVLNGIKTQREWEVISSTIEAYIIANKIDADITSITSENGKANFDTLKPGLYLVLGGSVTQGDLDYYFDSSIISLPTLDDNGLWQYDVEVNSKPQVLPPIDSDEEIEYKIVKLWKDENNASSRPKSVEVEIFCDGELFNSVVLSEENNWSYFWSSKDEIEKWTVVEKNVPAKYIMTVEEKEKTFVLTNTFENNEVDKSVSTGDTSNMLVYILVMIVSGFMLVVLGFVGKRKRL